MTIETRPIGLPIEEPSLATWWPRLDFEFQASNEYVATGGTATLAFTPTATALATGDLAGAATLAFTPTATAPGSQTVVTESVRIQTTTHEIRVFLPRAA